MINGIVYDWENIEIMTPGGLLINAKSISYKHSKGLDRVHDNKGKVAGGIRKNYEASGELELPRYERDQLVSALGSGYLGKAEFTIAVSFTNAEGLSTTDTLVGAVITDEDFSASQESEATVKLSFNAMELIAGGTEPII